MLSLKRLFLRTVGRWIPSDWFSYRMAVSVKGICFIDGKVILLKNERGQWDLPGGKMGSKEEIEVALKREMREELGVEVEVHKLMDAFRARIYRQINVLLIVYLCSTSAKEEELSMSYESFALQLFSPEELDGIHLAHHKWAELIKSAAAQLQKIQLES